MANLAQEEADRYLNHRETTSSHPEDRHHPDNDSSADEEEDTSEPAFHRNSLDHDADDDDDISHNMSTLTTTSRTTYKVPTQVSYANTGPKGVIADAQSYARARQESALRKPLASISKNRNTYQPDVLNSRREKKEEATSSQEDNSDEDEDDLMTQWRAKRIAELAQPQSQHQSSPHYLTSSSRSSSYNNCRTFGTLLSVSAEGYLDALDHSPPSTTVLVMLYDSSSLISQEVEDELTDLAAKYPHVRFVKMRSDVAEMEYLKIPAVLGYRGGEVFGTVSGARREGLEEVLRRQGFWQ